MPEEATFFDVRKETRIPIDSQAYKFAAMWLAIWAVFIAFGVYVGWPLICATIGCVVTTGILIPKRIKNLNEVQTYWSVRLILLGQYSMALLYCLSSLGLTLLGATTWSMGSVILFMIVYGYLKACVSFLLRQVKTEVSDGKLSVVRKIKDALFDSTLTLAKVMYFALLKKLDLAYDQVISRDPENAGEVAKATFQWWFDTVKVAVFTLVLYQAKAEAMLFGWMVPHPLLLLPLACFCLLGPIQYLLGRVKLWFKAKQQALHATMRSTLEPIMLSMEQAVMDIGGAAYAQQCINRAFRYNQQQKQGHALWYFLGDVVDGLSKALHYLPYVALVYWLVEQTLTPLGFLGLACILWPDFQQALSGFVSFFNGETSQAIARLEAFFHLKTQTKHAAWLTSRCISFPRRPRHMAVQPKSEQRISVKVRTQAHGVWFNDLRFQLEVGKVTIIKGRNGTGKSTLLDAMLGLFLKADKDDDVEITGVGPHAVFSLPQKPWSPSMSVNDYCGYGHIQDMHGNWHRSDFSSFQVRSLLREYGLSHAGVDGNTVVSTLSGGQQAKLAFVRMGCQMDSKIYPAESAQLQRGDHVLILVDEALRSMDQISAARALTTFMNYCRVQLGLVPTIAMVSHNVGLEGANTLTLTCGEEGIEVEEKSVNPVVLQ